MSPKDFDSPSQTSKTVSADDICVAEIAAHCESYKGGEAGRSIFQLITTLVLFAVNIAAMFYSLSISYGLTLLLSVPAAGLLTRIFIFQHDCGHGSFFQSKTANDWTGRALSLLTVTPYDFWRRAHNMHHAGSGDLDRRSIGTIDTITVREYQAMSKQEQFNYRLYRNPFLLLILGTPIYIILMQRLPLEQLSYFHDNYKTLPPSSIWRSIIYTDIALLLFFGVAGALVGFGALAAVYLPVLIITCWIGGWLFYMQHQFEETYWERSENWDMHESALLGSSYYELPRILQWFTGNIGLHHIHHLCSKIPNYKLQDCMDARPELREINRMGLRESIACAQLKLWDEDKNVMVSFKDIETA